MRILGGEKKMKKKLRVGVLFGGKSVEHEISLISARNVIDALDKDRFDVVLIGIDKEGTWHLHDAHHFLMHSEDPKLVRLHGVKEKVALVPKDEENQLVSLSGKALSGPIDVVFPILHGPFGEDGTVQGLLKMAGIPFVGPGVLSSAISMDKDVMKRLFEHAGIATPRFLSFRRPSFSSLIFKSLVRELGVPFFLKPANGGSSVGVFKVKSEEEFKVALAQASQYDDKLVFEEAIDAREIECSVLGNEEPLASLPGEVIPTHEFYSYAAKYLDENGAHLKVPADLDDTKVKEVQELAIKSFQVLECEGMARVDFLMRKSDGKLFLNEINTIPGFTDISMYPKLWQVSGLPYKKLLEKLIDLAIKRNVRENNLKVNYASL